MSERPCPVCNRRVCACDSRSPKRIESGWSTLVSRRVGWLLVIGAIVMFVLLTIALVGPEAWRAALWAPRIDVGGRR